MRFFESAKRGGTDDMRNWICNLIGMLLILVVTGITAFADQSVSLTGFQVLLFNSKTGLFSEDILKKGGPELGNVPIGEFASISTLVIVKVKIAKDAPIPQDLRVRLVAIESGSLPFAAKSTKRPDRVILDQKARLGPVNEQGLSHVGFWLADTGCRSITLKASLIGIPVSQSISEVLPFTCYE